MTDLTVPRGFRIDQVPLHPQAGFFHATVDETCQTVHKNLAALVELHSKGLPLMVGKSDENVLKRSINR